MTHSLLIRGGSIVTAERQFAADIRVVGAKIAEIDQDLPRHEEDEHEIDARGLLVLPGGVDPHVHLSMPDSVPARYRWADDFTSGSRAALAGGMTSLGNMATPAPGETPLDTLQRETELVRQQAIADVFLHPIFHPPSQAALRQLSQLGAGGFTSIKIFMCAADFDRHAPEYLLALRAAGRAGMLTMIHCEDAAMLSAIPQLMLAQGRGSLRYYAESRPVVAEVVATQRAVGMCEATGAPIYVVHLSSERALRVCEEAQAHGLPVYVETRPIFLYLTRQRYLEPDGALYVVQPPLRESHDLDALWDGLCRGAIHTLATDHAPHTRGHKLDPSLNVADLCPGINELQVMLPMFYSEGVLGGKISPQQFVALTSTHAAKLFGLYPRKGTVAVGSDADLCLWDPNEKRQIRGAELESAARFSVYEGQEVTGWPKITIRRGQIVYHNGQVVAPPGSGQLLECGPSQGLNP